MKKVITYGTYDLFHYGHYLLLKRAKALGDYLVVGVSTDEFCEQGKGKICVLPLELRKQIIEDLSFVDEVIVEHSFWQKTEDIKKYDIDIFCMGDDYKESFFTTPESVPVKEKCECIFLERTPEVSTSNLKEKLLKQLQTQKKV